MKNKFETCQKCLIESEKINIMKYYKNLII